MLLVVLLTCVFELEQSLYVVEVDSTAFDASHFMSPSTRELHVSTKTIHRKAFILFDVAIVCWVLVEIISACRPR